VPTGTFGVGWHPVRWARKSISAQEWFSGLKLLRRSKCHTQAMALQDEHQAILCDVLAASGFWGGAGSSACQGFITELSRNFEVIYQQANARGSQLQIAGSHMASTDCAVGSR
jgi:Proteins of 100 residues with WXG